MRHARAPAIAASLLLSAAGHCESLQEIHTRTLSRIVYSKDDQRAYRYAPATGDCKAFAFTNYVDTTAAGYESTMRVCYTSKGEPHAYVQVGDVALDNRFTWVIPMSQQDCK